MYEVFKDKMRRGISLRHGEDVSEDSESDTESVYSMKDGRKKVHFTDSDAENKPEMRQDKKTDSWKRCRKSPNFRLLLLNRGDIPVGSDVFRQVLNEIKSVDSNGESERVRTDYERSLSPPGKSILKKK